MLAWAGVLLALTLGVPHEEYRERRDRLREALPNVPIVLQGQVDPDDPRLPRLPEPDFYYLTGWTQPGAVLLILPKGSHPDEILFLPPRNARREIYEGKRAAPGDEGLEKLTGFATVMSTDGWKEEVERRTADLPKVEKPDTIPEAIARLRMVKSPAELKLLEQSIAVTVDMHLAAWKRARAGLYEYQIESTMVSTMTEDGCERPAYSPLIASGPNSVTLHYRANRRRMDRGEVLLMDVGAECSAYAADITRTIPVSGHFTDRQRQIYNWVLGAQNAAIEAARPGVTLAEITQAARRYFAAQSPGLEKHFLHGIGHHVGLEVHDASILQDKLAPGMVITIEPGLYIAGEGIGIRIEDMVLITVSGARLLSGALPREAKEIEKRLVH